MSKEVEGAGSLGKLCIVNIQYSCGAGGRLWNEIWYLLSDPSQAIPVALILMINNIFNQKRLKLKVYLPLRPAGEVPTSARHGPH